MEKKIEIYKNSVMENLGNPIDWRHRIFRDDCGNSDYVDYNPDEDRWVWKSTGKEIEDLESLVVVL